MGAVLIWALTLANYLGLRIFALLNAKVAQLVEHDLAKVGVAGSNPVFRSKLNPLVRQRVFLFAKMFTEYRGILAFLPIPQGH